MESKNEHTGTWSYDAGLSENISVIIPDIPGLVANRRQPDPGRPGKGYSIVLEDKSPMYDSVTITFEFRAPDGSLFQRNMKFNILGDMRIWLKSDKVWFVNEDYDTFDLECKLIYFDPDKYEVILGGLADTDNFIKLELEKQDLDSEDEENVFIKITPIEGIYEKWDGERLIYEYSCFIAYRDKETLEEIAATPFIVHFCYECIGVAIGDPDEIEGIDVRIDKLPEPFELWAFKDYEAHKRTEEKLNLAFFVSRWNKKEEKIEFDKEAAKSLKLTFDIESLSEHFDGANKDEAIKALKESEITYRCFDRKEEAKTNINKNIMYREGMNPAYYVVVTKNETKGNMESFPIVLNVSLPGHKYTKYKDLELKGTFYPARDWAEIVKWFFAFSKEIGRAHV